MRCSDTDGAYDLRGSIPLDGQEHRFSSDTHPSLMAPKSFLSYTLVTAFADG